MADSYLNIPVPTPTQNAVPSADIRDHVFGGAKIDEFVTSLVSTYTDRFGVQHYTIEGLRWLAQQAIAQYGWIPFGTFQAGATLSLPNQILKDEVSGEFYRWDGSLPKTVPTGSTPASTGGTGIGAWISVGDSSLRAMMAAADGRKYIGKAPTIAALRGIEPTQGNQWIDVEKYWADSRSFYGSYVYDASDTTTADNGGTVIVTVGGKRWKWTFLSGPTVETYGAYGDGVHDDSAAFTRCIAVEGTIRFFAPKYIIGSSLEPLYSHQIFQGSGKGPGGSELVTPNGGNIFEYKLTYREGAHYRDFKLSSSVPGTGKGFYCATSIYMANPTFENLNFDASLAFCIDANLVLSNGKDCWFGLEGTRGASHQHIRASGQTLVGSNLTTNANYWHNCRFYRSNSAYGIDVVNGYMWHFNQCYWETNINSAGPLRFSGILGVYITGCGFERNTGPQTIKAQMDSTGTIQGVMVMAVINSQIKLDDATNVCAVSSDTNNFNLSMMDCTGTAFAGKDLFRVSGVSNPLPYLKGWKNNYLVGLNFLPQNVTWIPDLRVNGVEFDDLVTGSRLGKIIANSTRIILSHDVGVTFQNAAGKVLGEWVTTATGTQLRMLSQDGTTLWKLQPPTSGSTPTAAQWTLA